MYLSAYVLELFQPLTAEGALNAEEHGRFDQLAEARQAFSVNLRLAWSMLDRMRGSALPFPAT